MTSTMQRELQELRAAAESYGARHVHLEHFAYPPGIRMAVNLTVDFDAILTLPYYYHFDDQYFLMFPPPGLGSGLENPEPFLTNCLLECDAQYKRGRYFSMVLHPHIIGFGHSMRRLEALFSHLQDFSGIWNPTAVQCAHYWQAHYPASTTLHLEPSIWQDYPGSLS